MYKTIHTLAQLQEYLNGKTQVAFDLETDPLDQYRSEDKAALDAHKSHIVGISFSVAEGDGVYLPLAHRVGQNATDPEAIWEYLAKFFACIGIVKISTLPLTRRTFWIFVTYVLTFNRKIKIFL